MIIDFHKKFDKHYQRLTPKLRTKIDKILKIFVANPFDPILGNHPLKGSMQGKRSISVTGDLRIVFKEHENYTIVLVLDVGTHSQIYR